MRLKDRYYTLLCSIVIALIGIFIYSNVLKGAFIWDDDFLVCDNAYIKNFSNIYKIFVSPIHLIYDAPFYRPVQLVSYMIDYVFWKNNPFGYHLINVILHIFTAFLVFYFVQLLFKKRILSFFSAILFLVHPAHTEAVSYISGRSDMLCLLFIILSFIFYIRAVNVVMYLIMAICYLLALFSRENAIVFPLFILLYHYSFKQKLKSSKFCILGGCILYYLLFRISILGFFTRDIFAPTFLERLPGIFAAFLSYIRLLFLPFFLHMEYGRKLFSFYDIKVIAGIAVFLCYLIWLFKIRNKNKILFFGGMWFLIGFLPVSNIIPLNSFMAEHWLYMPSIGFFLIIAGFLNFVYEKQGFRKSVVVSMSAAIVSFSFLTVKQNTYWIDPENFYERTLRYAPDSSRIYYNLGVLRMQKGNAEEAGLLFEKAVTAGPDTDALYNKLAMAFIILGEEERAVALYNECINIWPNFADTYSRLGLLYGKLGRYDHAISCFKRAVMLNPESGFYYINLASAEYYKAEYEQAVKYRDKAIDLGYKETPLFLKELSLTDLIDLEECNK